MVDGRWERYYGFVGRHCVARVSAAEIEFTLPAATGYWMARPGGIDTEFSDSKGAWTIGYGYNARGINMAALPMGQPVNARLAIRNRKGADITVPTAFFQDEANPKLLPPGIKLTVFCSEITPTNPDPAQGWDINKLQWKELPIREGSYAKGGGGQVVMQTAGEKTLFNIDLRDFFDMSAHGVYRVKVAYLLPGPLADQAEEATFIVGDSPWPAMPEGF